MIHQEVPTVSTPRQFSLIAIIVSRNARSELNTAVCNFDSYFRCLMPKSCRRFIVEHFAPNPEERLLHTLLIKCTIFLNSPVLLDWISNLLDSRKFSFSAAFLLLCQKEAWNLPGRYHYVTMTTVDAGALNRKQISTEFLNTLYRDHYACETWA